MQPPQEPANAAGTPTLAALLAAKVGTTRFVMLKRALFAGRRTTLRFQCAVVPGGRDSNGAALTARVRIGSTPRTHFGIVLSTTTVRQCLLWPKKAAIPRLVVMALSLRKSSLFSPSRTVAETYAPDTNESAAFQRALVALRTQLHDKNCDGSVFLGQIADDAQYFAAADSAVIALGEPGRIVCVARSGLIGPAVGSPLGTRSGITGECLRRRSTLQCDDSETDPRVDAEVCRSLGIRSLAVVPVLKNGDAVGVLEVFSSQPNAFQAHQVSVLKELAVLISQAPTEPDASIRTSLPLLLENKEHTPQIFDFFANLRVPDGWVEAFQLRPYQIAIVSAFLLLDLIMIYWHAR